MVPMGFVTSFLVAAQLCRKRINMALLEIDNLTVEFKTGSGAFRAVDEVSFKVDKGEVLAIVGESGSGKSVAMLAVMGLLPWTATVTADRMSFDSQDLLTM